MIARRYWQRILFGAAMLSLSSGIFAMAGANRSWSAQGTEGRAVTNFPCG
jgi:hypothetical protein